MPKGIIEIGKEGILLSVKDNILKIKYQSIISAGKSGLNLVLFLRNGNPEE